MECGNYYKRHTHNRPSEQNWFLETQHIWSSYMHQGRLWHSLDWRYRGHQAHNMEEIMDPRCQIITHNTEKPKVHTINIRPINVRITTRTEIYCRSGDTPQTNKCFYEFRKHAISCMDQNISSKISKAVGRLLRALELWQRAHRISPLSTLHIAGVLN